MAKFKDYISQTVPKEYSDIALGNVGALKYGKDFETDMPRKNEQVSINIFHLSWKNVVKEKQLFFYDHSLNNKQSYA